MVHVNIVHCNLIYRIGNQTTDSSGALGCFDEMIADVKSCSNDVLNLVTSVDKTETLLPQTETFYQPLSSVVSTSIPLVVGLKRNWKLGELLLRNVLFVNIV